MLPPLQLTAVLARTVKFDPEAVEEDEPSSDRLSETVGGALMREAESLLHAADSIVNATSAPTASLNGTGFRIRCIEILCAYIWASFGSGGSESAGIRKELSALSHGIAHEPSSFLRRMSSAANQFVIARKAITTCCYIHL
jgi:hypothetical protein